MTQPRFAVSPQSLLAALDVVDRFFDVANRLALEGDDTRAKQATAMAVSYFDSLPSTAVPLSLDVSTDTDTDTDDHGPTDDLRANEDTPTDPRLSMEVPTRAPFMGECAYSFVAGWAFGDSSAMTAPGRCNWVCWAYPQGNTVWCPPEDPPTDDGVQVLAESAWEWALTAPMPAGTVSLPEDPFATWDGHRWESGAYA